MSGRVAAFLRRVEAFSSLVEVVGAGEADVLVVSDDRGAVQLWWDGLREQLPRLGLAAAFVDVAEMALSPALLLSSLSAAVAEAMGSKRSKAVEAPVWLAGRSDRAVSSGRDVGAISDEILALTEDFVSRSSKRGLRPVLVLRGLTGLKALKSHPGVDEPFAMLGGVFARVGQLRTVLLEYGQSVEAVFEQAGALLDRLQLRPLVMPRLSADEVSAVVKAVFGRRLTAQQGEFLRLLCDGRLSYLLCFCESLLAGYESGWPSQAELIGSMAEQLRDGLSAISLLCRSRFEDALKSARGDTVLRQIMRVLSFEERVSASRVAAMIARSVPATFDYLGWLVRSLVLQRQEGEYSYRDRVLRLWVRLDTVALQGGKTSKQAVERAIDDVLLQARPGALREDWLPERPAKPKAATEEEAEILYEVRKRPVGDMMEFD